MENINDLINDVERDNSNYASYRQGRKDERKRIEIKEKERKIRNLKIFKRALSIVGVSVVLATLPHACSYILDRNNEIAEQEFESMKDEVEDLTGRSMNEITESGKSKH